MTFFYKRSATPPVWTNKLSRSISDGDKKLPNRDLCVYLVEALTTPATGSPVGESADGCFVDKPVRVKDPAKVVCQEVVDIFRTRYEAPFLALSKPDHVAVACLIGGVEIPLAAYAPISLPGSVDALLYHEHMFALDRALANGIDQRVYQASAKSYKAAVLVTEGIAGVDKDSLRIHKPLSQEHIFRGSLGILTGLLLRMSSLQDKKTADFYSLYLLMFFVLDDTTERLIDVEKARAFSEKALAILKGTLAVDQLPKHEVSPGYYLAAQFNQMSLDILGVKPAELDTKLATWYGLMEDQFTSAVDEVASKSDVSKILPAYDEHAVKREFSIGTKPCLELVDVLVGVTWSEPMKSTLKGVEAMVATAVFEFNNVVSLHKELEEAFVGKDVCALFNAQTRVDRLSGEVQSMLPLNGVLIRAYHSKIPLLSSMMQGLAVYDDTVRELEKTLTDLCAQTSIPNEIEALQARLSLVVGST